MLKRSSKKELYTKEVLFNKDCDVYIVVESLKELKKVGNLLRILTFEKVSIQVFLLNVKYLILI